MLKDLGPLHTANLGPYVSASFAELALGVTCDRCLHRLLLTDPKDVHFTTVYWELDLRLTAIVYVTCPHCAHKRAIHRYEDADSLTSAAALVAASPLQQLDARTLSSAFERWLLTPRAPIPAKGMYSSGRTN